MFSFSISIMCIYLAVRGGMKMTYFVISWFMPQNSEDCFILEVLLCCIHGKAKTYFPVFEEVFCFTSVYGFIRIGNITDLNRGTTCLNVLFIVFLESEFVVDHDSQIFGVPHTRKPVSVSHNLLYHLVSSPP